jgi:asparagine synthase (glutamine-hydrolysing)
MFAFALWDGRSGTLFCARDRFGEKPFVYGWVGSAFAFASEVKALGLLGGFDASVDEGVLAWHAARGSTWLDASERTLVRGARQLMPAHALKLRVGAAGAELVRLWQYWAIDTHTRHAYGADSQSLAARQLLDLLTDSVRLRLRSDVPVGSCLSGGLDSSTVVSLMRRLEPGADLRTFTGRFPGDPLDEGRFARLASEANRTVAREVAPTPERFEREAERVYWHADFPIGGMSQFAQWCVFHLASQHGVTVLLDGQGSDEQFGGYGNAIAEAFLGQLAAEGRWQPWARERRAAARVSPELFSWPRLALNKTPLRMLRPALRRLGGRARFDRRSIFRREWLEASGPLCPADEVIASSNGPHALSRTLWLLSFRTMLSALLRFGDRLSMAHSREVRLPFCDHRIAEFAFSLAPDLLVGEGQVKRVLRLAVNGLVPDEIVARRKQGFIAPQEKWLVGPLDGWVKDLVHSALPLLPMLDAHVIDAVAYAAANERARDATAVWEIANILAWAKYALDPLRKSATLDALADVGRTAVVTTTH